MFELLQEYSKLPRLNKNEFRERHNLNKMDIYRMRQLTGEKPSVSDMSIQRVNGTLAKHKDDIKIIKKNGVYYAETSTSI